MAQRRTPLSNSEDGETQIQRSNVERVGPYLAALGIGVYVFFFYVRPSMEGILNPLARALGFETIFGLPPKLVAYSLVVLGVLCWLSPLLQTGVRSLLSRLGT